MILEPMAGPFIPLVGGEFCLLRCYSLVISQPLSLLLRKIVTLVGSAW
jgi:hypothetical protein